MGLRIDGRPWHDDSVEVAWVARRASHVPKSIKGLLLGLAAGLGLELTGDAARPSSPRLPGDRSVSATDPLATA